MSNATESGSGTGRREGTRAGLDKESTAVAAMFDGVAERYDVTNTVLSMGQDRLWRRATHKAVRPGRGERILDVAAGTGASTAGFAAAGARAIACDFSLGMLEAGRERGLRMIAGDALALPFADGVFEVVTISFGLRNVSDPDAALAEFARVTRPGGRLVICEFSRPVWGWFDKVYARYLLGALPKVADRVATNSEAYRYLAESIRAWPDQNELGRRIGAAGWSRVGYRNLTGGIVALHRARRP